MGYHSPISDRNPETNNRQLLILFALFSGVGLTIIIGLFILLNQVVNLIPVSVEQKIGSLIVNEYKQKNKLSSTEIKLNKIVDKLEQLLPSNTTEKRNYQVLYIPEDTVNALAIPGDTIIIYEGLLKQVESENELVMILSHEIGHFAHRDHLRSLGNIFLTKLLINYLLGGVEILQSGADFTNILAHAQYSQAQEKKADEYGLDLLNKYYGHVAGATDFFQRLMTENKQTEQRNIIAFIASHPLPEKRIKNLEKLIKNKGYILQKKVDWIDN
ncbi:M48 family metallopeptidase [Geminocystis sp. NIES-3709]|uniref:M48 family metallopeptidase n=1 Tax=Geminocystis sp. NIES-3709 TaxID=1617448 RepID=UPI0005FCD812|nr:M48 family metallopeptidase [Geminocystis sp. NIES-3709]BAQ63756.1 peptidase M48 [Geminocystis sp. NIES-3709]